MTALNKLVKRLKELSPSALRECIAIVVILGLSVAVSIPQFSNDLKTAELQKEMLKDDGYFQYADPEEQGMDKAVLEEGASSLSNTSALSFIVIRNGKNVFEKYYDDKSANNVYSVTKSFMSALIGIAIREGYIGSENDTVEKYLPEYFKNLSDPRWKQVTIKHLLTMTPGFLEDLDKWTSSEDWVRATFSLPLEYDPGSKFQYANSASHLLSVILTRTSGMSTGDFADKYLFGPLGIKCTAWGTDPSGFYTGYANLYLTPYDLAKFGWLYYNQGKWGNTQVVPKEWVIKSTKVQYDFNKEKDSGYENGYGYKWWINSASGYHSFNALGYGGQSITVFPDLGIVVVITSNPIGTSINDEQRIQFMKDCIIGAIKK